MLTSTTLEQAKVAAAVRTGALARVGEAVYLAPAAVAAAAEPLRALPQPFTLAQARQAWGTSRRVAIPLLQHLDAQGLTRRLPDDSRHLLHPEQWWGQTRSGGRPETTDGA